MKIDDRNKLIEWLDQNFSFEDGYISKIENNSKGLFITIGFQIEGGYVAGEPIKLKEYVICPIGLKNFAYDKSKFTPSYDWSIVAVNLPEKEFGLRFETPYIFELMCDSIDISEPKIINTYARPWTSEREIFVTVNNTEIPRPQKWVEFFNKYNLQIGFRCYCGKLEPLDTIPYPDYSGYYIQQKERIDITTRGLFIKSIKKIDQKTSFVFELQEDETKLLWEKLHLIISDWNNIKVESGNITFNNNEWKNYTETGIFPRELDKIKNVC